MKQLPELNAWIELEKHSQSLRFATIANLKKSGLRNKLLKVNTANLHIDFSNQRIDQTTIDLLLALAEARNLKEKIDSLLKGKNINLSENRPALHTALRNFDRKPIIVNHHDIIPDIWETRERMHYISEQIRTKQWKGYSGKAITDIVNIGIGGSDLGPRFCIKALSEFTAKEFGYHFVSDIDPNAFKNAVAKLNPETTLFIISSKSFTTEETLYNAQKAFTWIGKSRQLDQHFIAVTANIKKAQEFGIKNVLPIWPWVGGRYSLCSAINLIT